MTKELTCYFICTDGLAVDESTIGSKEGMKMLFMKQFNSVGKESHLAIETSGHGATKENHWLDDGAYLMVKLLNKFASVRASGQTVGSKVLTDLVEELHEPDVAVLFLILMFINLSLGNLLFRRRFGTSTNQDIVKNGRFAIRDSQSSLITLQW
ncbi:hypothetical protein OROMI_009504 [Orobanche minor]